MNPTDRPVTRKYGRGRGRTRSGGRGIVDRGRRFGQGSLPETMGHVALDASGAWVALVGFGAATLSCKLREAHLGWSDDQYFARLRCVTASVQFSMTADDSLEVPFD